jgi:hypothetical protein
MLRLMLETAAEKSRDVAAWPACAWDRNGRQHAMGDKEMSRAVPAACRCLHFYMFDDIKKFKQ